MCLFTTEGKGSAMGAAGGKRLVFSSIFNVRDLGGYQSVAGPTKEHRFLRSGDTMFLTDEDRQTLLDYGVRRVVDLRMSVERPDLSNRLAHVDGVAWMNSSMADDRTMTEDWMGSGRVVGFVVEGYWRMLSDKEGIRRIISFMAEAGPDDCILFHCAGGMDRTGVISMLVLANAGVLRDDVIWDYAYAFGPDDEVDEIVRTWDPAAAAPEHDGTLTRLYAMAALYDSVVERHGSVRNYLFSCGVTEEEAQRLADHLVA